MRMILACLFAGLFLILMKPLQLRAMYLKKHGRPEGCYRISDKCVPWWMHQILKIAGIRLDVEGLENLPASPAVFVCNHQSLVDIPTLLVGLDRPRALMAKDSLGRIPLLKGWMMLFDCLFVKREDPKAALRSYEDGVHLVKSGRDLVIFPEGTRSKDGQLLEFKGGSFRIASACGVPLVPLVIDGSRQTLEMNRGWLRPGVIRLRVYPAIPTAGISREERKALPQKVHDLMEDELKKLRSC